jgi:hypothetical protein
MTINVTPASPGQIIRIFSPPIVREIPLPATPAGSAW